MPALHLSSPLLSSPRSFLVTPLSPQLLFLFIFTFTHRAEGADPEQLAELKSERDGRAAPRRTDANGDEGVGEARDEEEWAAMEAAAAEPQSPVFWLMQAVVLAGPVRRAAGCASVREEAVFERARRCVDVCAHLVLISIK